MYLEMHLEKKCVRLLVYILANKNQSNARLEIDSLKNCLTLFPREVHTIIGNCLSE